VIQNTTVIIITVVQNKNDMFVTYRWQYTKHHLKKIIVSCIYRKTIVLKIWLFTILKPADAACCRWNTN